MYHVEKIDAGLLAIMNATFPGYKGNKVKISTIHPNRLDSYWDGGSRRYYVFYSLDDGRMIEVESNHPFFEAGKPNYLETLPKRLLLVEHTIFCGKDMGLTIYANQEDLAPMLPKNDGELSEHQRIVLTFTKCYKSSYGGQKNYRWVEAARVHNITFDAWNKAKDELISLGMLNKAGAITSKGRNAIEGKETQRY